MTDKEIVFRLNDMREFAVRAVRFVGDRAASDIAADDTISLALVRAVQIVGEAARKIPEETRQRAPEIAWRQAVAIRNILVHGYRDIDYEIVVDTVRHDFPGLIEAVERLLTEEEGRS